MYPRKRIDIGWRDLGAGLLACRQSSKHEATSAQLHRIERKWRGPHYAAAAVIGQSPWICTLSVRTGFDLALQALALPPGSEILVSAITIPHMLDIITHHGLVAVPVDLDMHTLSVDVDAFERALTPRTRAILVAHLFGSRMPLDALTAFAKKHDLLLFEDAAQAFVGDGYVGHPGSDLCMFSFGSIKSFTALGGAMINVADAHLRRAMREILATYPEQHTDTYFKKLLKHVPLRYVGGSPTRYEVLTVLASTFAEGHDHLVMSLTRGFPGSELISRIRFRPCPALLTVLERRLTDAHAAHLNMRRRLGEQLCARLSAHVEVPGAGASHHTWWLFPIVVPEPDTLRVILQDAGFDAALGSTSLTWVRPCDEHTTDPENARRVMSSILYLPLDPAMAPDTLDTMSALVIDYIKAHQQGDQCAHAAARQDTPTARLPHSDSELSRHLGSDEEADRNARCA